MPTRIRTAVVFAVVFSLSIAAPGLESWAGVGEVVGARNTGAAVVRPVTAPPMELGRLSPSPAPALETLDPIVETAEVSWPAAEPIAPAPASLAHSVGLEAGLSPMGSRSLPTIGDADAVARLPAESAVFFLGGLFDRGRRLTGSLPLELSRELRRLRPDTSRYPPMSIGVSLDSWSKDFTRRKKYRLVALKQIEEYRHIDTHRWLEFPYIRELDDIMPSVALLAQRDPEIDVRLAAVRVLGRGAFYGASAARKALLTIHYNPWTSEAVKAEVEAALEPLTQRAVDAGLAALAKPSTDSERRQEAQALLKEATHALNDSSLSPLLRALRARALEQASEAVRSNLDAPPDALAPALDRLRRLLQSTDIRPFNAIPPLSASPARLVASLKRRARFFKRPDLKAVYLTAGVEAVLYAALAPLVHIGNAALTGILFFVTFIPGFFFGLTGIGESKKISFFGLEFTPKFVAQALMFTSLCGLAMPVLASGNSHGFYSISDVFSGWCFALAGFCALGLNLPGLWGKMGVLAGRSKKQIRLAAQSVEMDWPMRAWLKGLTGWGEERRRALREMPLDAPRALAMRPILKALWKYGWNPSAEWHALVQNGILDILAMRPDDESIDFLKWIPTEPYLINDPQVSIKARRLLAELETQRAESRRLERLATLAREISPENPGRLLELLKRAQTYLKPPAKAPESFIERRQADALRAESEALGAALEARDPAAILIAARLERLLGQAEPQGPSH